MGGEAAEGRKRAAESLGWLTESSVMPKQHKAIAGVGAASMVELRAQFYRTQEEARKAKDLAASSSDAATEFLRAKKKPLAPDLFSHQNAGVDARAKKDKLELKAIDDGSASYAALERKAELYDKLTRGELSDEDEKYSVDFFSKRQVEEEQEQPESCEISNTVQPENEGVDDDDGLLDATPVASGHTDSTIDHEEHKRFIREVHEEANQARQKASTVRLRRQEEAAARREKLRQAFLRKKLEKLTSANVHNGN